ncbi:MAG: peptidoglycan-binding protein [Ruminococcus sp.]|nr:peptidoglycan-binding protein [Ruminococcus sp.]
MKVKKIISVLLVVVLIAGVCVIGTISSGASGTGTGLAEWALNAYYSKWSYVYGGATPGAVDCSGLIYSYAGGYRVGDAQTFNSSYRGYLSDGIPNIHGLGLYKPGHVGVYVGGGMAVDARGSQWGVCYESVYSHGWTQYFKVPGVSYPTTGWEKFSGNYYYYENGQYLASTSRTIDGETYYFDSNGISSSTPSDSSSSSSSDSSSSSSGSSSSSTESSVLKKGSQGEKVEKLQQRLADLGFYQGAIDGDFGDRTELAFKQFQQAAGLYVDGIAGSDTDVLFSDDAPRFGEDEDEEEATVERSEDEDLADSGAQEEAEEETSTTFKKGDYDEDLIPVQERLIELGYLDGDADGSFGSMTEEAVTGFQGHNNLEKTGEVDEKTYEVLFSDDAKKNPEQKPTEAATEAKAQTPAAAAAPVTPTTAAKTEVEVKTAELSNKALSGVTDSIGVNTNGTNFEFIIWLAVMIVVMIITFIIVYNVQKKKAKAYVGRRYQ